MEIIDYPIPTVATQDAFCHPKLNSPLRAVDRLRASGDRLVAGGRDVPLFGVNLGVILTDEGAFEFLAGMGVNFVRITAPYREWTQEGNVRVFDRTPLDPPQSDLEALNKMQSLCEKHGIYMMITDFNRGIGRDRVTDVDSRAFQGFAADSSPLGLWHPEVRAAVIERIRRLLRTTNPHTSRAFGASPSLFAIQPVNEVMWFVSDLEVANSRLWTRLASARPAIVGALGGPNALRASAPAERFRTLARATNDAYSSVKSAIVSELGDSRPLLVADMGPYAGGAAFAAFASCDAYGLNIYPEIGDHADVNGPIKAGDLRPEQNLDRMQARLGGKPTIITEAGEKLSPGGNARLIAEITVRAGVGGFAGIAFHQMYRGIYGEHSGKREHLSSRAPLTNFELHTDPAALCALQACSIIHRKRLIRGGEKRVRIERTADEWTTQTATFGWQPHDLHRLAAKLFPNATRELGAPETAIVFVPGPGATAEIERNRDAGTIQRGHVRVGFVEIDWHTDAQPERDWLFIRVPISPNRRLVVLVGRAKPDPAQQRFSGGRATLSGLVRYPWPDPRTGYGARQLVRRPEGPQIFVGGPVSVVQPNGRRGTRASFAQSPGHLPKNGVRFIEELPEALVLRIMQ